MPNYRMIAALLIFPLMLAAVLPAAAQTAAPNPFEQPLVAQFGALETQLGNAARAAGDTARAAQTYKTQAEQAQQKADQLQARVKEVEDKCGDRCKPEKPQAEAKPETPAPAPQP